MAAFRESAEENGVRARVRVRVGVKVRVKARVELRRMGPMLVKWVSSKVLNEMSEECYNPTPVKLKHNTLLVMRILLYAAWLF